MHEMNSLGEKSVLDESNKDANMNRGEDLSSRVRQH